MTLSHELRDDGLRIVEGEDKPDFSGFRYVGAYARLIVDGVAPAFLDEFEVFAQGS
jgi:hypothetical protein